MKQNGKWWTHVCKDVGETQIPYGQPCNWCDTTEHDVMRKVIDEKQDILEDPEKWRSKYA